MRNESCSFQASIWHCLNHYAFGDATFLAERLFAEVSTDDSLHLLATCYFRADKVFQAYDLLSKRGARTTKNRFLLAKCCQKLKKNAEAEAVLNPGDALDPRKDVSADEMSAELGDSAAFGLQILATLYAQSERIAKANDCDKKALKMNPFLWKSFEGLCRRGDQPDPAKTFSVAGLDNFAQCHGVNSIINLVNNNAAAAAAAAAAANTTTTVITAPKTTQTPQSHSQQQQLLTPAPYPNITVTSTPNNNSGIVPSPAADLLATPANVIDITPENVGMMQIDPQIEGTPLNNM